MRPWPAAAATSAPRRTCASPGPAPSPLRAAPASRSESSAVREPRRGGLGPGGRVPSSASSSASHADWTSDRLRLPRANRQQRRGEAQQVRALAYTVSDPATHLPLGLVKGQDARRVQVDLVQGCPAQARGWAVRPRARGCGFQRGAAYDLHVPVRPNAGSPALRRLRLGRDDGYLALGQASQGWAGGLGERLGTTPGLSRPHTFSPINRFSSVDLPAFGGPTIVACSDRACSGWSSGGDRSTIRRAGAARPEQSGRL